MALSQILQALDLPDPISGIRDIQSKFTVSNAFKMAMGRVKREKKSPRDNITERKTTTQVENRINQGGDIILAESQNFTIKAPIKDSIINIYNPRRVIMGEGGSTDPTTRAERREEELEARRRGGVGGFAGLMGMGAVGGGGFAGGRGGGGGGDGGDAQPGAGFGGGGIAETLGVVAPLLLRGSGLFSFLNPFAKGFMKADTLRGPVFQTFGKALQKTQIPRLLSFLNPVRRTGQLFSLIGRGGDLLNDFVDKRFPSTMSEAFPTVRNMASKVPDFLRRIPDAGRRAAVTGFDLLRRTPAAVSEGLTPITRAATTAASTMREVAMGANVFRSRQVQGAVGAAARTIGSGALKTGRFLFGGLTIPIELGLYGIIDGLRRSQNIQSTLKSIQSDLASGPLGAQQARFNMLKTLTGLPPQAYHQQMVGFLGQLQEEYQTAKNRHMSLTRQYREELQALRLDPTASEFSHETSLRDPGEFPTQAEFLAAFGNVVAFASPELNNRTFRPTTIAGLANLHNDRIKQLDSGEGLVYDISPLEQLQLEVINLGQAQRTAAMAPGANQAMMEGLDNVAPTGALEPITSPFRGASDARGGNTPVIINNNVNNQIVDQPLSTRPSPTASEITADYNRRKTPQS